MATKKQTLEDSLEHALDEQQGLVGMALVSRDGIPVLSRFTRTFDQRTFSILVESAMVATLAGSAEEAITELEGGRVERVIVEAEDLLLIVVEADEDLLLVAIAEPNAPLGQLRDAMDAARSGIAPNL